MFKVNSLSMLSQAVLPAHKHKASGQLFKVEKKTLKPIPEKVKNVYGAKGPKDTQLKFVSAGVPQAYKGINL